MNLIESSKDLHQWLKADNQQYTLSNGIKFKDFILRNEKWYIYNLKRELRYVEYYLNVGHKGLRNIPFLWHWLRYKHLCWKTKCIINPNTCGPGLTICHLGSFTYIKKGAIIGKNFTIVCGVVVGRKRNGVEPVKIGDNCFCGLNVCLLGTLNIGDNVTIGANSVVTKDIPDNAVVGGTPAKIIRYKND